MACTRPMSSASAASGVSSTSTSTLSVVAVSEAVSGERAGRATRPGLVAVSCSRIVALFRDRGRLADLVLYACTSGYPVPFEDVCLLEVQRLREAYGADVHAVGFSGHHLGIAADVAALALGAQYVERHFTLDRTSKGTDHAASLEPDGMRKLARDLRNVAKALTYKPSDVLPIEETQREKLKWRG